MTYYIKCMRHIENFEKIISMYNLRIIYTNFLVQRRYKEFSSNTKFPKLEKNLARACNRTTGVKLIRGSNREFRNLARQAWGLHRNGEDESKTECENHRAR